MVQSTNVIKKPAHAIEQTRLSTAFSALGLDQQTATIADVEETWQQLVLLHRCDATRDHYSLLMTFLTKPWIKSADGKHWTPKPPKEMGPLRLAEDSNARIDATGLPISTERGQCVCEYCEFQRRRGGQSPHSKSADEHANRPSPQDELDSIRRTDKPCMHEMLYDDLPNCDLWKRSTPETLAYLGHALDKHVHLATYIFERVMRQALLKDGYQGQAEKWFSFRDGFPFTNGAIPTAGSKPVFPTRSSDFPTSKLAATANFCMLTVRALQKMDDDDRASYSGPGSIDLFVQKMLVQVKRWRALVDVMMPLTQPGAINPVRIGKTTLAIHRLVTVTMALCHDYKK